MNETIQNYINTNILDQCKKDRLIHKVINLEPSVNIENEYIDRLFERICREIAQKNPKFNLDEAIQKKDFNVNDFKDLILNMMEQTMIHPVSFPMMIEDQKIQCIYSYENFQLSILCKFAFQDELKSEFTEIFEEIKAKEQQQAKEQQAKAEESKYPTIYDMPEVKMNNLISHPDRDEQMNQSNIFSDPNPIPPTINQSQPSQRFPPTDNSPISPRPIPNQILPQSQPSHPVKQQNIKTSNPSAQWQEKDPQEEWHAGFQLEDQYLPKIIYPHQKTVISIESTSNTDAQYYMFAISKRGKSHCHLGTYSDDAFHYHFKGNWSIFTVCDGAGSAKYSRIASHIASIKMIACIQEVLRDEITEDDWDFNRDCFSKSMLINLKKGMLNALGQTWNEINQFAKAQQQSIKDFHTTILCLLHTTYRNTDCLISVNIGDGLIVATDENQNQSILSVPMSGDFGGETIFLTSLTQHHFSKENLGFSENIFKCSFKKNFKAVALMTDGVSDDFDNPKDLFYGNPVPEMKAYHQSNNHLSNQYGLLTDLPNKQGCILDEILLNLSDQKIFLTDWISYEKKQSFDDRTLIVLYKKT